MHLKDIVSPSLISCQPMDSAEELSRLMRTNDVGCVVVVDTSRKPLGIVTDRDIVLECVALGKAPRETSAREIMTKNVETAGYNDSITDVMKKMQSGGVRRLVVIDDEIRASGLVSFGDVFKYWTTQLHTLADQICPPEPKIPEAAA